MFFILRWEIGEFLADPELQSNDYIVRDIEGDSAVLERVHNYSSENNTIWGINARNREQNYALNLLMDPQFDFVTLLGPAGTGKTLLTLAAGLEQILEQNLYSEIIIRFSLYCAKFMIFKLRYSVNFIIFSKILLFLSNNL